jgi:hypothetical protein
MCSSALVLGLAALLSIAVEREGRVGRRALRGRTVPLTKKTRPGPRIGGQRVAFPACVLRPDGVKRMAMVQRLSVGGALLAVSTRLQVDDRISLAVYVTGLPDEESFTTRARVVRVEPIEPRARGLWTRRIAVQFDEPPRIG